MKNDFFHIRPIGFGLAVLGFLTVMPSWASGRQQLQGHVPADVATALMVGDVDDSQSLHLAVGLPLRHQDDLKSLIQNLYDPHSSQYRRYLTPDQFAQMFGPTPEDYQKLREFFESNGLSVVGTSPNRLLLDLTATAADARRVFHVTLHNYRRADGTQFYAPDSEPSVDLDLPISRVSGLDNAAAPHSNLILKGPVEINPAGGSTGLKRSPNTGTGPGGTYWGSDFRNIYVPCTSQTGTGQNIALFELDTYKAANITNYENDTGIGSPSLTKVTVGNAIKRPGSGEVEVELDIEMAMSMAPGAGIYVYENPGDSSAELDDLLNAIANPTSPNPLCYEISSSWSWTGNFDENVPPIFQQY
ncbi:MAG TPA: protease pro-enzyme activation domain-containing protein, partial [bacterium]|nr:protease pro-enzyme activation domain-containing protein [bacterium]